MLHHNGRPPGPLVTVDKKGRQKMLQMTIDVGSAVKVLEALDGSQDDLAKVLRIESIIYPKSSRIK